MGRREKSYLDTSLIYWEFRNNGLPHLRKHNRTGKGSEQGTKDD